MTTNTVSVDIFPWLTDAFGGGRSHRLHLEEERHEGDTVRDLLLRLARHYPLFAQRIFNPETQALSELVSLFCNDRFLVLAGGLDTPLAPGDELLLLPAWEGGC